MANELFPTGFSHPGCLAESLRRADWKGTLGKPATALRSTTALVALVLAGFAMPMPWSANEAFAVDMQWQGVNNNWTDASNWSNGGPPTIADSARIIAAGTAGTSAILFGGAAGFAFDVLVQQGNSLVVAGGGTTLNVADLITLSASPSAAPTMTVSSGASVTSTRIWIGDSPGGDALLTVSGAGSTLTASPTGLGNSRFQVGAESNGTLLIANGGTVTVNAGQQLRLGYVTASDTHDGTLRMGNGGTSGTLNASSIFFWTAGSQIAFNHTGNLTFAPDISGLGSITKEGTGTTILTGNNTYTGGTTLTAGAIAVTNDDSLGTGPLTVTGASTLISSALPSVVPTLANNISLSDAPLTVQIGETTAAHLLLSGVISGAGSLNVTRFPGNAAGFFRLTNANTYSGGTTINDVGILITDGAAFGTGTITANEAHPETRNLISINNAASQILANNIILSAGSELAILGQSANHNVSGNISGPGALFLTAPANILTLAGINTHTGTTTVGGGTLRPGSATALSAASAHIVSAGATLDLGGFSQVIGSLAGAGNVVLASASLLTGGNNASTVFSGVLSGNGTLTKQGSGEMQLTNGANNNGGTVGVTGGRLMATVAGALGTTSNKIIVDGATAVLDLGGTNHQKSQAQLVNGAIEDGTLEVADYDQFNGTLAADATINASASFDIRAGNVDGRLTGAGQLNKTSAGAATLDNGANDFTGLVSVLDGQINVTAAGALGAANGDITVNGASAVLDLGGTAQAKNNVDLVLGFIQGGALDVTTEITQVGGSFESDAIANTPAYSLGGGLLAGDVNLTNQFAMDGGTVVATSTIFNTDAAATAFEMRAGDVFGVLAGPGGLTKVTGGGVLLAGPNTYAGGTVITDGTIQVGSGTALGTGGVDIAAAGILDINGFATAVLTISGAGTVINSGAGTATLIVGNAAAAEFSGAVEDGVSQTALTKTGVGTLILSGGNNYTGATTVLAGELRANGALGATPVTVGSGATLSGIGTIGGDVTVAGGGTLAAGQSAGTLTVGSLSLDGGSVLDYELGTPNVVGSGVNDLIVVTGNLVLDGILNITDIGGFGPGIYRLINYGGAFTDSGLDLGGLPAGIDASDLFVQTSIASQVNLISAAGTTLSFWDGGDAALHNNGVTEGGDGIWNAVSRNWTQADGAINGPWDSDFSIFGGIAGTVSIDNAGGAVTFTGMQFMAHGYVVSGDGLTTQTAETIIRTDSGVTATIAAGIAGTGRLVKTDTGTLVLSGTNTYAGGTTINGGTLQVSADANLGAAGGGLSLNGGTLATTASFDSARAVTLASTGGAFDVAAAASLGLSGMISGASSLTKQGAGTLVLSGANSYSGNTTVAAGTLVGKAASIRGNIANAGTVVFDQAGSTTFAGAISGAGGSNGGMVKNGAGILTLTGASSLVWAINAGGLVSAAERFTGNAAVAAGAMLSFDQTANATYAGAVSGAGGLTKQGAGTLVLSGANSYTGATTVAAGLLAVNGSIAGSAVTVASGGRLGGTGTVGAATVTSGGTLAPGNSIGTLNVAGNVNFAAGAAFELEIDAAGQSDLLHASGAATLNGGTVSVLAADGAYAAGQRYTILTADGGVGGSFAGLTQNLVFLDLDLAYGPNSVFLDIARNDVSFCDAAATANQCATGHGAESLGAGNTVYDAILNLPDEAAARAAFDRLSGEMHASAKGMLLDDSRFVRDAAAERIRAAFAGIAATSAPVMAYGAGGPELVAVDSERFAVWGQAFGAWGSLDGDGNAADFDHSGGGFLAGGDALLGETWRLGVLAGYSRSSFDVDDRNSSGDSDNIHLGLYGGTQRGNLGVSAGAAYSWHDIETARTVNFAGFADRLTASYDAGTAQAFGELGYRIETGSAVIEPFANLAYVDLGTDGFTEHGGAAALASTKTSTDATFTTLGLRAATSFMLGAMQAEARGMIGWRHAFGDTVPGSTFAFASGTPLTIAGTPIAEDALALEAGFDLDLAPNATFGISYSGQIASDAADHAAKANLTIRF